MTKSKTIAVIGGGIGGLTVAIALQKKGFSPVVFESAPEIRPLGAGIVLAANAIKAFREIGLEHQILDAGSELRNFFIRDQSGRILSATDSQRVSARFGVTHSVALQRAVLHNVLISSLLPESLQTGKSCVDFKINPDSVTLSFNDATTFEADYVIAADGIHSLFRKRLVGSTTLRYSGYTCWRGITDRLPAGHGRDDASEFWGTGKRFGLVPVSGNKIYWFATVNAREKDATYDNYTVEDVAGLFGDFSPVVSEVVRSTASNAMIRNDIHDVEPISQYSFGRIVLLGDAAHATTPNLGQGACMAIEDAAVLANLMDSSEDFENAFRQYEARRLPRTSRVVKTSWQMGKIGQLENPFLVWMRNAAMRLTPASVSERQLDFLFNISFS